MTKMPRISGKEVISALQRAGFIIRHQKGSHVVMRHQSDLSRRCVIPVHGSQIIKSGTLNSILRGASISIEELISFLKK